MCVFCDSITMVTRPPDATTIFMYNMIPEQVKYYMSRVRIQVDIPIFAGAQVELEE
jgi:hypothetical protein